MYPNDVPLPKKSRRLLWIGIAAAVVVLLVVVVAIIALSAPQKDTSSTATEQAQPTATNDEVKQDMALLDAAIKQSDTDRAEARAALQSDSTRTKVSD